ncbi:MAG: DedA family protein [Pseudomonadota bacterium]|jgi:membrane protein DedA with SNARE-associated domain
MTLGALIETHGYWVLAVGCLLEGETILVLAGFAAHRGYLDPLAVLGIAAAAGFLGDQFYFWLGRRHGPAVLARWPSVAHQADRVHRLMERYHAAVIIGVRFAYGLRIAGPVLIGTSPIPGSRFALFNALGAILWACVVAGIGWVFGEAAEIVLGEIRNLEGWLLLGLIAAAAIAWWIRKDRTR